MENELNDSLDDMLGGTIVPERVRPTPPANYQAPTYTEGCKACGGSGRFRSYSGRVLGECFKCKGKGSKTFKSSPEKRAQGRVSAAKRAETKATDLAAAAAAWSEEHKAEAEWLAQAARRNAERGGTFGFPQDLLDKLALYGTLSEGQLAAVQRLMLRDTERNAERTKQAQERAASAPAVEVAKIEEAFAKAIANQVRSPKLRLDTFIFKPAKAHSKNAGAIYVTEGEEYLGKVMGGKFLCVATCGDERRDRVTAAANDPAAAATAYGRRFGECSICGRTLTKNQSIDRSVGPICASKYGW